CWIPPEFKPAWEQYAETYCWLKNTYFVPPNGSIPGGRDVHPSPKHVRSRRGPDQDAGRHGVNCVDDSQEKREDKIKKLAWYFRTAIEKKIRKQSGFFYNLKKVLIRYLLIGRAAYGRYLINVYIVIKLLYIANVVGQFFLLNGFLGTDYDFYGLGVLRDLWNNHDWRTARHFPRVTLCDFNVRVIGNSHPRTLQCVLIFVFLWFMLLFVAVVTILDALFWLRGPSYQTGASPPCAACWSPRSLPGDAPQMLNLRTFDLEQFFNDYIDSDGAFLLRMIGKNAGEPVLKELLQRLWADYRAPLMNRAAAKGPAALTRSRGDSPGTPVIPPKQVSPVHLGGSNSGGSGGGSGCGVGGGAASSAPWPVLVARMRPHMILPQPPGLINKGPLIRVGHAAPLQSQLLADLGVGSRGFALARRRR
uniref:Innexin n=1 Tax=Macrostomum lignano TaxID=282301 RepID=A0A1I8JQL7_9PLAT